MKPQRNGGREIDQRADTGRRQFAMPLRRFSALLRKQRAPTKRSPFYLPSAPTAPAHQNCSTQERAKYWRQTAVRPVADRIPAAPSAMPEWKQNRRRRRHPKCVPSLRPFRFDDRCVQSPTNQSRHLPQCHRHHTNTLPFPIRDRYLRQFSPSAKPRAPVSVTPRDLPPSRSRREKPRCGRLRLAKREKF